MNRIELAETLELSAAADIWFDAADHGDEGAQKSISDAQEAMVEAARILRGESQKAPVIAAPVNEPQMFLVTWEMHIEADDPTEAAKQAWAHMRRPESTANVFDVVDQSGTKERVDLQVIMEGGDE
jgi:hypothetical protein